MKINKLILFLSLFLINTACAIPVLNSLPNASATIFLDFDGHYVSTVVWNGGMPIDCQSSGLTDAQITEAFNRVAEDYAVFNVNVTTDSTKFLAAPIANRIRVIVTPTSSWYQGVGGIAYIGSFTWGDDTPCFVFCDRLGPNNPKYVGECCSHESGHTLGLSHQSTYDNNCNLIEQYASGAGSGQEGWSPIMGNSYYRNMTTWNNGVTINGCNATQDNLQIITTQNGFGYKQDDFAETMNANTKTIDLNTSPVNGIIGTNTDVDAFRFIVTKGSNIHFEIKPKSVGANNTGANLNVEVKLCDINGVVIQTYDPINSLDVTVDTMLSPSTYYFLVKGSNQHIYSTYGSIGEYTINGLSAPLPIYSVVLSAKANQNMHQLQWSINASEEIKNISVEYATNATDFKEVASLPGTAITTQIPAKSGDAYYRLKVTSVIDEVGYSNVVALKGTESNTIQLISKNVTNEIQVMSKESFLYNFYNMSGALLKTGKGANGLNKIDVTRFTSGVYIVELIGSNNKKINTQIIKM